MDLKTMQRLCGRLNGADSVYPATYIDNSLAYNKIKLTLNKP